MSSPSGSRRRRFPWFVRLAITLVIVGGLGWGGWIAWKQISPGLFGTKREDFVPTAPVAKATIAEEIVTVGRLRAVFSTELRAEVNGRIVKLAVSDGQSVVRGQEILQLDQQDILTQLTEVERSIEAAKLRTERARRDAERLKILGEQGLVTPKDADDARTTFALAENDAAIAEARAANLRDRLTKTVIRAPHDGTLLLKDLTEGQVITGVGAQSGGTLLGEVADMSALMVRTNINEIDVARLKVDDKARVRIDPLRDLTMGGVVRRIASSAVENQQDRTRVFPVDVALDAADERLRPGMSATVTFTLSRAENTPSIVLSAVFSGTDGSRYVFVRKDDEFVVRPVKIGITDVRNAQVLSGLDEGEFVALTRPAKFTGEIPGGGAPGMSGPRPTGTPQFRGG
jgi:RND family efflux transporter MFP subunit